MSTPRTSITYTLNYLLNYTLDYTLNYTRYFVLSPWQSIPALHFGTPFRHSIPALHSGSPLHSGNPLKTHHLGVACRSHNPVQHPRVKESEGA